MSEQSTTNTVPPEIKEGVVIRWEYVTPNGFQHWRIKSGVFQFTAFPKEDYDLLEWGDRVQESHERGMVRYVNMCSGCGEKFLNGTLILVPYFCDGCRREYYELRSIAREYEQSNPERYKKLTDTIDDMYQMKIVNKKEME